MKHLWTQRDKEMAPQEGPVHIVSPFATNEIRQATPEFDKPTPRKEPVTWADVKANGPRGQKGLPRARLFRFSQRDEPTVIRDKFGPGRDQYSFPIDEVIGGDIVYGYLTTASKGLLEQIQGEIKDYGTADDTGMSATIFERTYVLAREGEGMKTTYILRGYDRQNDALSVYESMCEYLEAVGK